MKTSSPGRSPAILPAVLLVLLLSGCSSIRGRLPQRSPPPATDTFQGGAARADITPHPGFPMGGHSLAGVISRGYWTRLQARALYLEDPDGAALVLVSADLWSVPAGLGDRVAELLHQHPATRHLGRDQLLLAATHTHHGPGNFSSSPFYNQFASCRSGFDPRLFEYLAGRLAAVIVEAAEDRQPVRLFFKAQPLERFFRNRSYAAFLLNPESRQVLERNAGLPMAEPQPEFPDPAAAHAVDPRVALLRLETLDGTLLAAAGFLAVHPTAMKATTPLYHGDVFAVATRLAEQRLQTPDRQPVIALFNGANGDQSTWWQHQDRTDTLQLGRHLADHLRRLTIGGQPLQGPVDWQFARVPLKDQAFLDPEGRLRRTADRPLPGVAALGGAEDGRSFAAHLGWIEGVRGAYTPGHGPKHPALEPRFLSSPLPFSLTRLVMGRFRLPERVPIGVYALGPLRMATLPGEFTLVMGERVARHLSRQTGVPLDDVLLVGLANEYVSYFATPEEYDAQHYEGASTLFGPASGPLLQQALARLASQLGQTRGTPPAASFRYPTGPRTRFTGGDIGAPPYRFDDGLATVLLDPVTRHPLRNLPHFEWDDVAPRLPRQARDDRPTPAAVIAIRQPDGSWSPLTLDGVLESDDGLNFVTLLLQVEDRGSRWCVIWMPPPAVDPSASYRFQITTLTGHHRVSPPFRIPGPGD